MVDGSPTGHFTVARYYDSDEEDLTGSRVRLAFARISSPAGVAAEGLAERVPQRTHVRARETTNAIEADGSRSGSARTV